MTPAPAPDSGRCEPSLNEIRVSGGGSVTLSVKNSIASALVAGPPL